MSMIDFGVPPQMEFVSFTKSKTWQFMLFTGEPFEQKWTADMDTKDYYDVGLAKKVGLHPINDRYDTFIAYSRPDTKSRWVFRKLQLAVTLRYALATLRPATDDIVTATKTGKGRGTRYDCEKAPNPSLYSTACSDWLDFIGKPAEDTEIPF